MIDDVHTGTGWVLDGECARRPWTTRRASSVAAVAAGAAAAAGAALALAVVLAGGDLLLLAALDAAALGVDYDDAIAVALPGEDEEVDRSEIKSA